MALVMAIGMMAVLGLAATTAIAYSTSNSTQSSYSKTKSTSFNLAEAGINDVMSVLSLPSNNALDPDTLPKCTTNGTKYTASTAVRTATSTWRQSSYDGGTVYWCGTLIKDQALWYVTAIGSLRNPNGPSSGTVTRTLEATVTIMPTLTQPLNNPVWDYLYAGHTGSTCDQTLNNNISGSSRMYIAGNLCLSPNVILAQDTVIVGGDVNVNNNAAIGASTSMSTRVESYVGGNCIYGTGTWATCTGDQDARHIYSKLTGGTIGVNHTPPVVPPPTADFATWYENAIPGPSQTCTTSSGTVPTFDTNYPSRDNSVTTPFDLTPASAYECRVGPEGSPSGLIKWTPPTGSAPGQLELEGTIYIDGSAKINVGTASSTFAVDYSGMATLYLSGTFLLNGKLCGIVDSTKKACDTTNWNPSNALLTVVANGSGGQIDPGDGIQVANNSEIQGGVYATNNVELGNNAVVDGPIVGSQIVLSNNLTTHSFPLLTTVPVGMPSNPAVYAQPNPPQYFSG
jgi:hypothetical protein